MIRRSLWYPMRIKDTRLNVEEENEDEDDR